MTNPVIRLLVLDDNDDDAELEVTSLRRSGLALDVTKVTSRRELEDRLAAPQARWDVVVSDYMMPDFTGLDALRMLRESGVDASFILVSGTVGEELAVAALHAGADDYILKDHLDARLAASVKRSLRERETARVERRQRGWLDLLARTGRALPQSLDVAHVIRAIAHAIVDERIPHCRIVAGAHAVSAGTSRDGLDDIELKLEARNRVIGAITLMTANRLFEEEAAFAKELAARVALSIDNALLYEDAQRGIRMRDEFITMASHEFRTPVMALQLQLESSVKMLEPIRGVEAIGERLTRARAATERLALLVENLLDVSLMAAGPIAITPVLARLDDVVRAVVMRFAGSALRAGSTLVAEPSPEVLARFDVGRIEQLVANLIDNAIKFGDKKPITVAVERDDDGATIRVVDEGIGIPSDKAAAIFERFHRGVSTRRYGGLGLGLYNARAIVDAHEGRIAARVREGGGTVLEVWLPLAGPGRDATQGRRP